MNSNRIRVITFANSARLKTIYGHKQYIEAGGLMSYGPDILEMFRRAAELVDKILRGTKPADIPVEQPTKFASGYQSQHGEEVLICRARCSPARTR